jgi:hypothetical protein
MCEPHYTQYSEGSGMFPLCEDCWSDLSIKERLPYYTQLVQQWIKQESDMGHKRKIQEILPLIIRAVEAGR